MTGEPRGWVVVDIAALAAVPSVHAVVAFFDKAGACVLLAATGDARAFCEKRLSAGPAHEAAGPARVEMLACGSMFEAELAYLHAARRLLPGTYPGMIDSWRAWFLRLDPARGVWQATNLHDCPGGVIVGPMPDKHAPARLGELIDDVFDLCRYPAELAKAPAGRACAYKEMGRCPAPCDGSEAWGSFAARFERAAASLGSIEVLRDAIESRMHDAAARSEFERAAHLKGRLGGLVRRGGRGLAHIAHLQSFARIAVVPRTGGDAGVYLCRGDGVRTVAELPAGPGTGDAAAVIAALARFGPLDAGFRPDTHQREELGFIARRLFMARRGESFLPPEEATYPDLLIRAATRRPPPEPDARTP